MKIAYSALTNKGKIRLENQDSLFLVDRRINEEAFSESGTLDSGESLCFAVFDGMGGGQCGRDASVLAADLLPLMRTGCSLPAAFSKINAAMETYMTDHALTLMGTTAAVIVLSGETAELCNIGDSGIYCIYRDRMVRLSENHSMQIGAGGKRYLTQYLGIRSEEMQIEPFAQTVRLCSGYRFLLCSDGLTDLVSEPEVGELMADASAKDACEALFARAMEHGGKDNISIILIDLID